MAPPFKRVITYRKPVHITIRNDDTVVGEVGGIVRIEMHGDHHIAYRKGAGATLQCAAIVPNDLVVIAVP